MASVFDKFGGIRPMANKIGLPSSTVNSWHAKRKIPAWRHDAILEVAKANGLHLTADELINLKTDNPAQREASAA
jgi:hypothetical protein